MVAMKMYARSNLGRSAVALGIAVVCAIACSSSGAATVVAEGGAPKACAEISGCPVAFCDCVNFTLTRTEFTNKPDKTCMSFETACDAFCKQSKSTIFEARCTSFAEFKARAQGYIGRLPGERCSLENNAQGACEFPEVLPRCPNGNMIPITLYDRIECPASTKVCPSEAELVARYCSRKDGG
jgi:hypothetical protein